MERGRRIAEARFEEIEHLNFADVSGSARPQSAVERKKPQRARIWVAAALLVAVSRAAAMSAADLLDPAEAFRLSAAALDTHDVEIRFRIAKGYYMYRDRFRFQTEDGRAIAPVELPRGEVKNDPYFGRTEIYRREVRIRLPLPDVDLAKRSARLKIISQGCADLGVCYVPQEQWVSVRYDPNASVEPGAGESGIETLLGGAPSPSPRGRIRP